MRARRTQDQLASDQISCRSALTNQMRLVLNDAIPRLRNLATAEFATLRLLKVAARVIDTASRVRCVFAAES